MKSLRIRFLLSLLMVAVCFTGPATATIMLGEGLIDGSGTVKNVVFNGDGTFNGPATTITGRLNHSDLLVDFTSTENIFNQGIGQASIDASDGAFNYLEWELQNQDMGFSVVQFNINTDSNTNTDNFKFTFLDQFGTSFVFNGGNTIYEDATLHLDKNGQNRFTAFSLDNQVIIKATIEVAGMSAILFEDVKQVRMGAVDRTSQPVPEPSVMLLVGAGLVGLAGSRLRRKKI